MIEEQAKRRAVGEIEWVIAKLKTHAEMGAGRPVNEATLRLMPSVEQCQQLAERLGAALVELQDKRATNAEGVRSSAWVGCAVCGGKTVSIRGRHPQDDAREVCPTCLAETLDDLRAVLAGANRPAQEAQPTSDSATKP
jgi:hypothetical protein